MIVSFHRVSLRATDCPKSFEMGSHWHQAGFATKTNMFFLALISPRRSSCLIPVIPLSAELRRIGETIETVAYDCNFLVKPLDDKLYCLSIGSQVDRKKSRYSNPSPSVTIFVIN